MYQADEAGNISPTETISALDVDLLPPTVPTITFPDPALAPDGSTDGTINGV